MDGEERETDRKKEGEREVRRKERGKEERKEEKEGVMDRDNLQTAYSVSICIQSNDHLADFSKFNLYKIVAIGQLTFILIYVLFFVLQ